MRFGVVCVRRFGVAACAAPATASLAVRLSELYACLMTAVPTTRNPIVLAPAAGRSYAMGRISALFKADGDETARAYSISEWWLDANTKGPGAHAHVEDDVFFVVEGTMSILVGEDWVDAPAGSFVLVPGGVTHDFENRSGARAGLLNFFPGVFEPEMPAIAEYYAAHPPGDAVAPSKEGR